MTSLLEFIFQSPWTYLGSIVLIISLGYSLSIPLFWYYKVRSMKRGKKIFGLYEN